MDWNFADPAAFQGFPAQSLDAARLVKNEIKAAVLPFVNDYPT